MNILQAIYMSAQSATKSFGGSGRFAKSTTQMVQRKYIHTSHVLYHQPLPEEVQRNREGKTLCFNGNKKVVIVEC